MPNWTHIKYPLEIMNDLKPLADANPTDLNLQKLKTDLIDEIKQHATN